MESPGADTLIALHKNATTTPATRAAIQGAAGSDYELAQQFRVSRDTVRKWRQRDSVVDRSHTAHRLQNDVERGARRAGDLPAHTAAVAP